ncbi:nuclear transport factor 2 family protein [Geodermatophilus sp. SYSU D00758]
MTQTVTSNVDTMQALYEAFGRGEVETVVAGMTEDVEWHEAESHPRHPGRAFTGPQEVVENVFAPLAADFEDFRVNPRRFLGDGDTVVVEGRYTATRGTATGLPLDIPFAHVWDLRDGRIARFQQYTDTRRLAEVMGA